MKLPITFAHKPVLPADEVRDMGYLTPACGIDLVLPKQHIDLSHGRSALAAAEVALLDAMGLQTLSSFFCVTFHWHGVYLRIHAWKPVAAQERQAA